jgi:hypothetical protein
MTGAGGASRSRPFLLALAIGALALWVGGRDLERAPVYLYHDEAIYALNAHSILTTGRDLYGLRLPLFLHTFAWVPPIAIYARVLEFMVAPVNVFTTRFPGIVFFALDVVLTYIVGRKLFKREGWAVLAAVLAMLTPAHLIHARMGTDHICGVPFFIGFVLGTIDFIERRAPASLFAATLCLGLGIYGYNGAITLTPVFLALLGGWLFFVLRLRSVRPYTVMSAGFAVALVPLLIWLLIHPEQLTDQLHSYDVSKAGAPTVSSGAGRAASAGAAVGSALAVRLDAYYNFFDPQLLFFRGDQSLLDSTREVGVFVLPILVLLPAGAYYILTRRSIPDRFVLASFLAAPIGALVVGEVKASRALVMVPLAALVAARGVEGLLQSRTRPWRAAAVVLVVAAVVQFQMFYKDYVGEYRQRASLAFESNRAEAFATLVARADGNGAMPIFISSDILLVNYSWQFYMLEHQRPELKSRARFVDRYYDVATAPRGSLFMVPSESEHASALDRSATVQRVAVIENIDRHPAFAIYER